MHNASFIKILGILALTIFLGSQLFSGTIVKADDIEDLQKQIDNLKNELSKAVSDTKTNESKLVSIKNQLTQIQNNISNLDKNITDKEKELKVRDEALSAQQDLLEKRVRVYYIRSFLTSPFILILSSQNPLSIFKDLTYRVATTREDQKVIRTITAEITDLTQQKEKLEKDKASLAVMKTEVNANAVSLDSQIRKSKAYQNNLNNQIASLTTKQQKLIEQKLASLNLPTSAMTAAYSCNDSNIDPGFSSRFAVFSFGVMNHIGLNQYGAKGRAEAGQKYDTILNAYYSNINIVPYSTSINITVNGYSPEYKQNFSNETYNIEEYVKHLYEMPTSWPMEALKAQAIAARSYALATTSDGKYTTCPSQSCQVIKHEINSAAWQQAVEETKGLVMVSRDDGKPIVAWFSSVHGGYVYKTTDIGWSSNSRTYDTNRPITWTKNALDGSVSPTNLTDLFNTSFDKSSPWFYCDWGTRSQYKSTAWLKEDEFADIVNVVMLAKLAQEDGSSGSVISHLSQLDKPNPDGVETWSPDKVKQEIRNRGKQPYSTVSSAGINWDKNIGRTTGVLVSGDVGSQTFDGTLFKSYYNLRAPANLQIVSLLYNIEKR